MLQYWPSITTEFADVCELQPEIDCSRGNIKYNEFELTCLITFLNSPSCRCKNFEINAESQHFILICIVSAPYMMQFKFDIN